MAKPFTDWSELNRLKGKTAETPKAVPLPAPTSVADDGAAEVLAYFSKGGTVPGRQQAKKVHQPTEAEALRAACRTLEEKVAALEAELAEVRSKGEERTEALARDAQAAAARIAELEGTLRSAQDRNAGFQAEVARLRAELEEAARQAQEASKSREIAEAANARSAESSNDRKTGETNDSLLSMPPGFAEAFEGELREMTVAALKDALKSAIDGGRQRRSTVLGAVLEANPASGELARRRAALKQIMKDSGYYTDPSALEKLGFELVSGHSHWKLEYADVRMPLAKTPSDYRANLNSAAEMANRCF